VRTYSYLCASNKPSLHLIEDRAVHYLLPILGHFSRAKQASTLRRRLFFAPISPSFARFSVCFSVSPENGSSPPCSMGGNKITGEFKPETSTSVPYFPTNPGACTPQCNFCRYTRSICDQSYTLPGAQELVMKSCIKAFSVPPPMIFSAFC
jgi:hypothetical protein